jgi:RNA polymerase sigma-70 factor, ECF subfamily
VPRTDDRQIDDARAITQVRAGDLEVYGELVHRYQGMLLSYAINRLADVGAAQEVVQLTFIRAHEQLDDFREDGNFGVWLAVICKNFILTELKRRKRELRNRDNYEQAFEFDRVERLEAAMEPDSGPVRDRLAILKGCLQRLQKEAASLLDCRYVNQMKCREIAALKGRSLTWVTSNLSRARKALRNCMEADG